MRTRGNSEACTATEAEARGDREGKGWGGFGGKQRGMGRRGSSSFQQVVESLKLGGTHWERPRRKKAGAESVR